jgi:hypothetical protein
MEYLFEKWNNLLSFKMRPENLSNADSQILRSLMNEFAEEKEVIRRTLRDTAIALASEKKLAFFVQWHQASLSKLLDKIYRYQQQVPEDSDLHSLYATVNEHLVVVMSYMEEHFLKFFDTDEIASQQYMVTSRQEFATQMAMFIEKISDSPHSITNAELISLLQDQFSGIGTNARVTYGQLFYYRELIQALITFASDLPATTGYPTLIALLLSRNFNTAAFMDYFIRIIQEDTDKLPSAGEKVTKLLQWRKSILQTPVLVNVSAIPKMPSARDYMQSWIDEEALYVKSITEAENNSTSNKNTALIKLNTSVKVAALIGRAALETKFILSDNKRETFGELSKFITTIGSETVSPKSLLKHGSNPEGRTKEMAKQILINMFNQVSKF